MNRDKVRVRITLVMTPEQYRDFKDSLDELVDAGLAVEIVERVDIIEEAP